MWTLCPSTATKRRELFIYLFVYFIFLDQFYKTPSEKSDRTEAADSIILIMDQNMNSLLFFFSFSLTDARVTAVPISGIDKINEKIILKKKLQRKYIEGNHIVEMKMWELV